MSSVLQWFYVESDMHFVAVAAGEEVVLKIVLCSLQVATHGGVFHCAVAHLVELLLRRFQGAVVVRRWFCRLRSP